VLAGLAAGSEGWSFAWRNDWTLIAGLRAPRTAGALLTGACLGLSGAIAQGLFRNPLADPYLLGSAAGAALAVTAVLAAGGATLGYAAAAPLAQLGLAAAAFTGALAGVTASLLLAGGSARPSTLLLAGVVVGVLAAALAELITLFAPQTLRGRQAFLLGTTAFVGWPGAMLLAAVLAGCTAVAVALGRTLDALVLGDSAAASLGLRLPALRATLVAAMALATGAAVAQAGLVAFVGLAAPHLVRRAVTVTHGPLLALSALAGGTLLLAADVAARSLIAPRELPVGLLTAAIGGGYLLLLLHRRAGGEATRAPRAPDTAGVPVAGKHAAQGVPAGGGPWTAGGAPDAVTREPAAAAAPPRLLADGLVVRRGGREVLDRVSVGFGRGEWTAVVGPNGAGKSTLLETLAGRLRPDAGQVVLEARALPDWPARARARALAWLPQSGEADGELATRDVVALGRLPHHGLLGGPTATDRAAIDAAMRDADCDALAGRRLASLSGGERQRVLIARAWATGAPVLLLDEPTAHLDAPHQRRLARALRERARAGATVVSVLHDLTLALGADRLVVLVDGRVHADGVPQDAALHAALREASGGAIRVQRIDGPEGLRWVAYPAE
jgi:iron complex transport system permease protein